MGEMSSELNIVRNGKLICRQIQLNFHGFSQMNIFFLHCLRYALHEATT